MDSYIRELAMMVQSGRRAEIKALYFNGYDFLGKCIGRIFFFKLTMHNKLQLTIRLHNAFHCYSILVFVPEKLTKMSDVQIIGIEFKCLSHEFIFSIQFWVLELLINSIRLIVSTINTELYTTFPLINPSPTPCF